jgi:valine dehydrogenase (NAD+)
LYGIEVASQKKFGRGLPGLTVAVKGVGKVGGRLVALLKEAGANVMIADINQRAIERMLAVYPDLVVVDPKNIHTQAVDVYAPCALGDEFTHDTVSQIQAKIICGAANNQLASDDVGDWLFAHGILYVPDYAANAGGLIDVVDELESGGFQKARVLARIAKIKQTIAEILTDAEARHESPHRIANQIAEQRFNGHAVVNDIEKNT